MYLMLFFMFQHVHAQLMDTAVSSTKSRPTRDPSTPTAASHWQCGCVESSAEPLVLLYIVTGAEL